MFVEPCLVMAVDKGRGASGGTKRIFKGVLGKEKSCSRSSCAPPRWFHLSCIAPNIPVDPNSDSHLPIALRKSIRLYTQHPIANHVCYNSLSPSFRVFPTSLPSISIPFSMSQALSQPYWRKAMEEMKIHQKKGKKKVN